VSRHPRILSLLRSPSPRANRCALRTALLGCGGSRTLAESSHSVSTERGIAELAVNQLPIVVFRSSSSLPRASSSSCLQFAGFVIISNHAAYTASANAAAAAAAAAADDDDGRNL